MRTETGENLQLTEDMESIRQGFLQEDHQFCCLICGRSYEKGEIYQEEGRFFDARKAAAMHVEQEHGGMLSYLLQLHCDLLGISLIQQSILRLMAQGLSDKEIAQKQGIAVSTMRNHRFKLREKEKQARLFMAMTGLLREHTSNTKKQEKEEFIEPHLSATMRDDRYCITEAERDKIITAYFDDKGALKEMPSKEKRKLVVLRVIASNFQQERRYNEKEVNRIIERIYSDYSYVRRLLIEYGFLDRTQNGTQYWVK